MSGTMKKKYESDSGFDRLVKAAFPPPTFVCEHCGSAIQGVPEQHFSKCESAPCNKAKLGTKRKTTMNLRFLKRRTLEIGFRIADFLFNVCHTLMSIMVWTGFKSEYFK